MILFDEKKKLAKTISQETLFSSDDIMWCLEYSESEEVTRTAIRLAITRNDCLKDTLVMLMGLETGTDAEELERPYQNE